MGKKMDSPPNSSLSSPVADPKVRQLESAIVVSSQTVFDLPFPDSAKGIPSLSARPSYKGALKSSPDPSTSLSQQWIPVGTFDIVLSVSNGIKNLSLSQGFKEKLCQPSSNSVVVRLLGKTIGYSYLCHRLRAVWKPSGFPTSAFIFTIARSSRPWGTSLEGQSNLISVLRRLNGANSLVLRWRLTWDCLSPVILLDGAVQQVEYGNLSNLCFGCGRVGHDQSDCRNRVVTVVVAAATSDSPPPPPVGDATGGDQGSSTENYGPWMIVARKSRRARNGNSLNKERESRSDGGEPHKATKIAGGAISQSTPT
ncbi:hypothetical protein LINPERHAP1_LOCUS15700 [Linum perenne]